MNVLKRLIQTHKKKVNNEPTISYTPTPDEAAALKMYSYTSSPAILKASRDNTGFLLKRANQIEEFISKSPKHDGSTPLYRGVHMIKSDLDKIKTGESIKPGNGGMSSFSGKKSVAEDFANNTRYSGTRKIGTEKVVFVSTTPDAAVSLKPYVADAAKDEEEYLFSKLYHPTVTKIETEKNGVTYIHIH